MTKRIKKPVDEALVDFICRKSWPIHDADMEKGKKGEIIGSSAEWRILIDCILVLRHKKRIYPQFTDEEVLNKIEELRLEKDAAP